MTLFSGRLPCARGPRSLKHHLILRRPPEENANALHSPHSAARKGSIWICSEYPSGYLVEERIQNLRAKVYPLNKRVHSSAYTGLPLALIV